jgi:hypothetical protein
MQLKVTMYLPLMVRRVFFWFGSQKSLFLLLVLGFGHGVFAHIDSPWQDSASSSNLPRGSSHS